MIAFCLYEQGSDASGLNRIESFSECRKQRVVGEIDRRIVDRYHPEITFRFEAHRRHACSPFAFEILKT